MTTCSICGRPLDTGDIKSIDCGGDCWWCIHEIEKMMEEDKDDKRATRRPHATLPSKPEA